MKPPMPYFGGPDSQSTLYHGQALDVLGSDPWAQSGESLLDQGAGS